MGQTRLYHCLTSLHDAYRNDEPSITVHGGHAKAVQLCVYPVYEYTGGLTNGDS